MIRFTFFFRRFGAFLTSLFTINVKLMTLAVHQFFFCFFSLLTSSKFRYLIVIVCCRRLYGFSTTSSAESYDEKADEW